MNPIAAFWIVMVCIAAGSLLGFVLRSVLPEHHLDKDAKDVVRLGTGLIASIAALVLKQHGRLGQYVLWRDQSSQVSR